MTEWPRMKALILFVGWCILFVLSWPVALLALVLFPVVWLVFFPTGIPVFPIV